MIRYECDKCGISMSANDPRRFIVRMELFAAVGHLELDTSESAAPGEEMSRVLSELATADPDEIEDQTYRSIRLDLCDKCHREFLRRPLG